MSNVYPKPGYRSRAARALSGGGEAFSSPPARPVPRIPIPANDNVPMPANDNVPRALSAGSKRRYIGAALRGLGRAAPFLALAYELYRLGEDIWGQGNPASWMVPGFSLVNDCGRIAPPTHHKQLGSPWFCLALSTLSGAHALGSPYDAAEVNVGMFISTPPNNLGRIASKWTYRPNGATVNTPPAYWYEPVPGELFWPVHPRIDPMSRPIGGMDVSPEPVPWPLRGRPTVRPDRVEHHDYGPRPRPRPDLNEAPVEVDSHARPGTRPRPQSRPRPQYRPEFRPPAPGEKERKVSSGVPVALMRVINGVTEAVDLIDALYEALPKALRAKEYRKSRSQTPSVPRKMKILYENYGELDIEQALNNIVRNQVIDYLFGKLGRARGRARRNLWDSYGADLSGITSGPALSGRI